MVQRSLSGWVRHRLALVLVVGTIGTGGAAAQSLDAETADIMAEIGDIAGELVTELEGIADPADAAVAALDADAAALRGFVGGGVAYVPYRGVLRGVAGVLSARVGNSYDQSIALASLLKRAGYEAQVLVGAEPETDAPYATARRAEPLVSQARVAPLYEELLELTAELAEAMDSEMPTYGAPAPLPEMDWAGDAVSAALAAMPEAEAAEPGPGPEADRYGLVRYRLSPSDGWTWFDPARNIEMLPGDATARTVLNETVPADDLHTVALTLSLVTAQGDARTLGYFSRPASALAVEPVTIAISPSEQTRTEPTVAMFDPRQGLVVAGNVFESVAVSLDGAVVPAAEMASGFGEIFRTGASLMGDAIETIRSGEKSKAKPFERVMLRVEAKSPGRRQPVVAERVLYDGAMARAALAGAEGHDALTAEARDAALRAHLLSEVSGDYIFHMGGHAGSGGRVELDMMRMLAALGEDLADGALNSPEASRAAADMMIAAIWRDLGRFFDEGDTVHTAPSAAMLIARKRLGEGYASGGVWVATDILIDGRTPQDDEAAAATSAAAAIDAARREAALADRLAALDAERIASPGAFEHLRAAVEAQVAPLSGADYLATLAGEPEAPGRAIHRDFLAAQLAVGRRVAVWPGQTHDATVWLEIDPLTDAARLAAGTGAGNELLEYIIVVDFILLKGLMNVAACNGKTGPALEKCLACALMKTGIGTVAALAGGVAGIVAAGTLDLAAEGYCL